MVSHVPATPSPPALPLFLRELLSEFARLTCGLCPARGLFGYKPLIAALRLSQRYLLFRPLLGRSVLSVLSLRSDAVSPELLVL